MIWYLERFCKMFQHWTNRKPIFLQAIAKTNFEKGLFTFWNGIIKFKTNLWIIIQIEKGLFLMFRLANSTFKQLQLSLFLTNVGLFQLSLVLTNVGLLQLSLVLTSVGLLQLSLVLTNVGLLQLSLVLTNKTFLEKRKSPECSKCYWIFFK